MDMYLKRTKSIFNVRRGMTDNINDDSNASLGEDDLLVCFSFLRYCWCCGYLLAT